MKLFLVFLTLFVLLHIGKCSVIERAPPTFDDDTITIYVRKLLENLRAQMPTGVPEIGIPPLEPLKIPPIHEKIKEGIADVELKFDDFEVKGLSKFNLKNINVDLGSLLANIDLFIPEVVGTSKYDLKGKLASIFPLYGNGDAIVRISDLDVGLKAGLDLSTGKLQLSSLDIKLDFSSLNTYLENILGGGSLGEVVNTVANMIGKKLFDNHKNELITALRQIILQAANRELANLEIGGGIFGYSADREQVDAANNYVDDLLKGLKPVLQGYDPLDIPTIKDGFEKKLGKLKFEGYAKLSDGKLRGLSTLHRTSDVIANINETSGQIVVSMGVGISYCVTTFNTELYFLGLRIRPGISATVQEVAVDVKATVNTQTGYKKLNEFRITKITKPKVKITNLSIFGSLLSFLSNLVIGPITNAIRNTVSNSIREEINKQLENFQIPL